MESGTEVELAPTAEASPYDCNICLATARNAVICVCGHLFCWPCLHRWMLTPCHLRRCCPACQTPLDITKVIPLYGRNSAVACAGADTMAPRPVPQRLEPPTDDGCSFLTHLLGLYEYQGDGNLPMESMSSALQPNDERALFFLFGLLCLGWLIL